MKGLRVLVADDNLLVSDFMQQILTELGCSVIGPANDLEEALNAVKTYEIDAALLDVQFGDANILPVAQELAARNIPFILTTGRGDLADLPALLANAQVVAKPFDVGRLERAMSRAFTARIDAAGM